MAEQLNTGDVVMLKSGGPAMTVILTCGRDWKPTTTPVVDPSAIQHPPGQEPPGYMASAFCCWFADGKFAKDWFPVVVLVKTSAPG